MKHPWSPQQFRAGAVAAGRPMPIVAAAQLAARAIKGKDSDLPVILTLGHLAHLAGISHGKARNYARRMTERPPYRVFLLKKRPGANGRAPRRAFRTICVPEPELMRLQRWINQNILTTGAAAPHAASFAYYAGRGILRAAACHVNCTWLVKMDVSDFFSSITERRVYEVFRELGYGALLSFQMARICTHILPGRVEPSIESFGLSDYYSPEEGRLPQGAPTSPALANLAVRKLDARLAHLANHLGWTYTRYADDLAFSVTRKSTRSEARALVAKVKRQLNDDGLMPNMAKTVIAPPGARRIVLGLQVDGPVPRLSRMFKINLDTHLRALTAPHIGPEKHQQARGFASSIGMRRHIGGLIAVAHHIEPAYTTRCYALFNAVSWPS